MIAHRKQFKEKRRERSSRMGKASGVARNQASEGREIGPRRIPYGKLLKVFMIHDPLSDEFHRYEVFKSFAGKRKIDLLIDRDTQTENLIKAKSATWLMNLLRSKMAMLAEIEED